MVVVGYSSQKKSLLTGSVGIVKNDNVKLIFSSKVMAGFIIGEHSVNKSPGFGKEVSGCTPCAA